MSKKGSRKSDGKSLENVGKKIEIVIPVMGPTGAGKSTFINAAVGRDVAAVGHRMASCTTHPSAFVVDPIPCSLPQLEGCRLVLLDTPGFDDTHQEDAEILKRIASWLEESCRNGGLVGGVLYLHDISAIRFNSTARQNLAMFSRLCGNIALGKTVLVTTNWGSGANDILQRREAEMQAQHWSIMMQQGVQVRQFLQDSTSAPDIINSLLQRFDGQDIQYLQIQMELVFQRKTIPQTEAGKELRLTLCQLLKTYEETVALESRAKNGDPDAQANIDEARKKIRKLQDQVQVLKAKLPLTRRFLRLFHFW